jgi:hypothetical protein
MSARSKYAWSFMIALIIVGTAAIAPAVGLLLAPGLLIAAILFRGGIHSDWAITYLVFAGLLNAFLLAWPVFWVWTWVERIRERR